ncbi:MAG: hypothetical protein KDC49_17995 [Saprospiraceae bacterium]|nr:hypothetical protein [Saprospiraceae bacterium]
MTGGPKHITILTLLKHIREWYVYGSFHIAVCTAAYAAFFYFAMDMIPDWNYVALIFLGTHIIYSLHKVLARERIENYQETRFKIVLGHQSHIIVYICCSLLVSIYILLQMEWHEVMLMLPPGIIAFLYVAPIFKSKKRLRDYSYIKIFLIALSFSLLCTFNPLFYEGVSIGRALLFTIISFFFVLGITIPFDIRDFSLDQADHVPTLVTAAGIEKSRLISIALLAFSATFFLFLAGFSIPTLAFSISCITGIIFSWYASLERNDYYYSFFMDGLLALPLVLYILLV